MHTRTSITLTWEPPRSCMQLEGYLIAYTYGVVRVMTKTKERVFRLENLPPGTLVKFEISAVSVCDEIGRSCKVYEQTGESLHMYISEYTSTHLHKIVTLTIQYTLIYISMYNEFLGSCTRGIVCDVCV